MPSKKKIVFVLSGYGRVVRGAERLVQQLVLRLSDEFDIQVLGSGTDAPHAVALKMVPREHRATRWIQQTPVLGHASRLFQLDPLNWEWMTSARAARNWLEKHPCDLLVPEGGRWGGRLGLWARKNKGIPFVDIAHGAMSRWETAAARCRPDAYVTPTRRMAEEMGRIVPGLHTEIIPCGVDLEHFSVSGPHETLPLQRPVVLAVGALEPLKRMDVLIRALHDGGRGSLLMVGDGPLRREWTELGRSLLGEGRFLCRSASYEEMPPLYRSADVLASASRSEAFGLVLLEALASGLPVVSQEDPWRREVLGEHAVWVEQEGVGAWVQGIERALAAAVSGRAARLDYVQRFHAERMAERYRTLFRTLLTR
ncbi:MAG: glycosyltransferase family 4 protein [Verrucomicrobiota bacterium]|nr:glycosyltransferase family 4 protein [Verrucomicrobiota bacterium]